VQGTINRWLSVKFQTENPEETQRIKEMIENTPVQGFVGCCQAISEFDVSGELFQVKAPTLILVGENDAGTPVIAAEEIQSNIPGSELEVLPEAQHLSNIEAASEFNRRLWDFLQ
jgi:3-oxoadipate enol-lactonase